MLRKTLMTAAIAGCLSTAFTVSTAAGAEPGDSMRVSLAGVDLHSDVGARTALSRIRRAAAQFCGDPTEPMSLGQRAVTKACYTHMTYLAVTKLDAPLVTAQYQTGGPAPEIRLARR